MYASLKTWRNFLFLTVHIELVRVETRLDPLLLNLRVTTSLQDPFRNIESQSMNLYFVWTNYKSGCILIFGSYEKNWLICAMILINPKESFNRI